MIKSPKRRRKSKKQNHPENLKELKQKSGITERHDIQEHDEEQSYAIFSVGEELFAINLDSILEILHEFDLVDVPHLPETFSGVVDLRGESIPVVELRNLLSEKNIETETRACLVTNVGTSKIGLLVDSDVEIVTSEQGDIHPLPDCFTKEETEFLDGIFWVKDKFVGLLRPKGMMETLAASKEKNEKI